MKIIISYINSTFEFSQYDHFMLKDSCESLGIDEPFLVTTKEMLAGKAEEFGKEEILLITNFPPNSSYPGSGKPIKEKDMGDYINRSWEADSYSISKDFFSNFLPKHTFKAVHFLTGSPEEKVSDSFLESLLPGTLIRVKRRKLMIGQSIPYKKLFLQYLLTCINESV